MTAITFDALSYSKALQDAGMPARHADALAEGQARALAELVATKDLATKKDLEQSKLSTLKWVMTAMTAQTGLLLAALALMR